MNNLVRPLSVENKNALLQRRLSLACSEIRSRNDEAIDSTRNMIYSLKVFHSLLLDIYFYLFLNSYSTRDSDEPEISLRSQALRGY